MNYHKLILTNVVSILFLFSSSITAMKKSDDRSSSFRIGSFSLPSLHISLTGLKDSLTAITSALPPKVVTYAVIGAVAVGCLGYVAKRIWDHGKKQKAIIEEAGSKLNFLAGETLRLQGINKDLEEQLASRPKDHDIQVLQAEKERLLASLQQYEEMRRAMHAGIEEALASAQTSDSAQ
jgi:hypothetical protein